jgi:hypothetical protein
VVRSRRGADSLGVDLGFVDEPAVDVEEPDEECVALAEADDEEAGFSAAAMAFATSVCT